MTSDQLGRRRFQDDLESLQETLLEMAGIVERTVGEAAAAVLQRDATVARRVQSEDDRIDELEV
jgi:phosphate uptake regulator